MGTLAVQEDVRIPLWVVDLETFRRWTRSESFPEYGRFSHLAGGLWVDLSMERFAHNQAKAKMSRKLGDLIEGGALGYFCPDGMQLVNVEADLSTEPDGMFISNKTLDAGLARIEQGDEALEVVGSPDLVLEVVSPSSVEKDTVLLPQLYWKAGVREYWLVDPRGTELHFDIFRHRETGYVATRRRQGWLTSVVLRKSFRLTKQTDARGNSLFTLEVR